MDYDNHVKKCTGVVTCLYQHSLALIAWIKHISIQGPNYVCFCNIVFLMAQCSRECQTKGEYHARTNFWVEWEVQDWKKKSFRTMSTQNGGKISQISRICIFAYNVWVKQFVCEMGTILGLSMNQISVNCVECVLNLVIQTVRVF